MTFRNIQKYVYLIAISALLIPFLSRYDATAQDALLGGIAKPVGDSGRFGVIAMVLLDSGPYTTDKRLFSTGHIYQVEEATKSIEQWLSGTISVGTHSLQIPQPMVQSAAKWMSKASEVHEKSVVAQSLHAFIPCTLTQVMDSFQNSLQSALPRVLSVADAPSLNFGIMAAVKNEQGSDKLTLERMVIRCSPTAMAVPKIRDQMAMLGLRVNADGTNAPVEFIDIKVLVHTEFQREGDVTNFTAPTYDDYVKVLCKGTDEQINSTRLQLERKWKDFLSRMEAKSQNSQEIEGKSNSQRSNRDSKTSESKRKREYEDSIQKFKQLELELFGGVKQLFSGTTRPYAQLAAIQRAVKKLNEVAPDQSFLPLFYRSLLYKPVVVVDLKGIFIVDGLTATRCAMVLAKHCQVETETNNASKGQKNPRIQQNDLEQEFIDWTEISKDSLQQSRDFIAKEDPKYWKPSFPVEPRNSLMPKPPDRDSIAFILMQREKERYRGRSLEETLLYGDKVKIIDLTAKQDDQNLTNFPFSTVSDVRDEFDQLLSLYQDRYKEEKELAESLESSGKLANNKDYLRFKSEYAQWQSEVATITEQWERLQSARLSSWESRKRSMNEIVNRIEEHTKTQKRLRMREPRLDAGPTALTDAHRSNEREKLFLVPSFEVLYQHGKLR